MYNIYKYYNRITETVSWNKSLNKNIQFDSIHPIYTLEEIAFNFTCGFLTVYIQALGIASFGELKVRMFDFVLPVLETQTIRWVFAINMGMLTSMVYLRQLCGIILPIFQHFSQRFWTQIRQIEGILEWVFFVPNWWIGRVRISFGQVENPSVVVDYFLWEECHNVICTLFQHCAGIVHGEYMITITLHISLAQHDKCDNSNWTR